MYKRERVDRFKILMGDITKQKVDAIVNAANCSLCGGGGVDGAIHRAAGPELLAECKTLGPCKTGQAKISKGYQLPAAYVIHTPGPVWRGGEQKEEQLLESCYRSCFALAREQGVKTMAFPSISTGIYSYPLKQAAAIAVSTILSELEKSPEMAEVQMVCFSQQVKAAYEKALEEICGKS